MFDLISIANAADAPQSYQSITSMGMILWFAVIFGIFYFLIIRPQRNEQKKKKLMIDELKRGDEVLLTGGLFGKVAEIKENNILMLQISGNTTVKVDRAHVALVIKEEEKK